MRDRVTAGVALIKVDTLVQAYEKWGAYYPICGDTLKTVHIDRLVEIKVRPLTEQDKRLIRIMKSRLASPELNWKAERK